MNLRTISSLLDQAIQYQHSRTFPAELLNPMTEEQRTLIVRDTLAEGLSSVVKRKLNVSLPSGQFETEYTGELVVLSKENYAALREAVENLVAIERAA